MTKASDFSSEQIQSALVVALEARDLKAAASLMTMLAVVDPEAAEACQAFIEALAEEGE